MRHSTFEDEVNIDYVLRKATVPSDVLVVSFPGAGGDRFAANNPVGLGYMMTIGQFNVNALYLKTAKDTENGLTDLNFIPHEKAVMNLVEFACRQTGATRCVGIGSSLGGRNSLYFGLKYNWDIIAGGARAPQDRPNGQAVRELIASANERGFNKHIYMCWGKGEPRWVDKTQAPAMLELFDQVRVPYKIDLFNYSVHGNISKVFPAIIKRELGGLLGVTSSAQQGEDESTEVDITAELNESIKGLEAYLAPLEQEAPNYKIKSRFNRPKVDEDIEPLSKALKTYKKNPNNDALSIVAKRLKKLFSRPSPVFTSRGVGRKVAGEKSLGWLASMQRADLLIDVACALRKNERKITKNEVDWVRLQAEVLAILKVVVKAEILLPRASNGYQRLRFLLLVAMFFKANAEFHTEVYKRVMSVALALTNYYFDDNGVCLYGQVRNHHRTLPRIKKLVKFAEANGFESNQDFKKLKRKLDAIEKAAVYLTRVDGVTPNIGHSDFDKSTLKPVTGSFIKTASNIAVLSGGGAYITIGGGPNIHSVHRHCDLLSFTFWYDGRQLVWDAGGGKGGLLDYARSAVAHSALLCDEQDYITPDYPDWTALHDAVETDEYVFVCGEHGLINGVTLSRKWLWLKPNILVIYDEAQSEGEHLYTQNYLFPNCAYDDADKLKVKFTPDPDCTLTVTQLPLDGDFALNKFFGTTDPHAPEKELRGSRVQEFGQCQPLVNLAYEKRAANTRFLTVLEVHSGREGELTFEAADVEGGILAVSATTTGEKRVTAREKLDRELHL